MDFFDLVLKKKLLILIISIILNVLLLSFGGYLLWNKLNHECITNSNENLVVLSTEEDIPTTFFVEVKGAVKKPGVFEVNSKNIINDVVTLAGGFTKKAYTKNINLSKKLSSELVIYVYTESEYKKLYKKEEVVKIVTEECECPTYDISECINNGSSEIVTNNNDIINENVVNDNTSNTDNKIDNDYTEKENNKEVDESNEKDNVVDDNKKEEIIETNLININTATLDELMTLNGIGESKAKSIIEYRNQNKFTVIEDIKNVSGIGEAAFEKIKDNITV